MTVDLTSLTIHEAITRMNAGELSAADVMRESLVRLEKTDDAIQSWVEIEPRYAMEMAMAADRRRSFGPAPQPLLGIPIGIKDMIDVAGMRTRCNMESRVDVDPAAYDADASAALRSDGAILLGKTVTQEAAAGVVSDPARNPWDPARIPGGSSGGSAAAIAAGTCLGALGTDTGGSIRTPAALVGVVGLKPTYGRLSTKGIFPLSPSMDTVGPMTKTVHDAAIMYLSLAGRRKEIPALAERLPDAGGKLEGTRIGVLRSYFLDRVQPGVASAFQDAVAALENLGAEIVECDWPEATAARAVALMMSRVESAAIHREQLRSAPELMGEALRSRLEAGSLVTGDDYLRVRQARPGIRASIAAVYRDHRLDAIVAPSAPATAPLADADVTYADGSTEAVGMAFTRLTGPWNATGQPVISVPCGFDADRLPVGLSFVGRPDEELALCDIAHAYERAAGWFRHWPRMQAP